MRQFLSASDEAFADLATQARTCGYVQFRDQELPPGCVPGRARIGFKVEPTSGCAILFVERGIRYYGANKSIQRWTQVGQITFAGFADLRRWVCSALRDEFNEASELLAANAGSVPPKSKPLQQQEAEQACSTAPQTPSEPKLEPILKSLLLFAIRQIGRNYNVEVRSVEDAVLLVLQEKMRENIKDAGCETVVDDILGGPFALAALQEHPTISVHVGPPINCKPLPK